MKAEMYLLNTMIANAQTNDVYPQVEHMGQDYDWDAADSITQITASAPLRQMPNLASFHLAAATCFTDVVSQGYVYTRGILVSEAFHRILQSQVTQKHEAYAVEVVHLLEKRRYYWIHMIEEVEDRVDYNGSRFAVQAAGGTASKVLEILSREDLRATARRLVDSLSGRLLPRTIAFVPGTPTYDLFALQLTSLEFLVSPRLADRLAAARLTGFEIGIRVEVVYPERAG